MHVFLVSLKIYTKVDNIVYKQRFLCENIFTGPNSVTSFQLFENMGKLIECDSALAQPSISKYVNYVLGKPNKMFSGISLMFLYVGPRVGQ